MRFVLDTEQQDMAETLRDVLARAEVPAISRDWAEGDSASWRKLWGRLGELGVTGLTAPVERGGLGLGPVELAVVLQECGYAGLPGPVIESLALLPALVPEFDGSEVGTAVIPQVLPYALDADQAEAIYDCGPGGPRRLTGASLHRKESFDPARRLFEVDHAGAEGVPSAPFEPAFDLAVLGCAAYLLGMGYRALDLATEHVKQRHQFGRPVGEYQAVKHHLADALLDLEFARPLVRAAALSVRGPHGARDTSAAKLTAGDSAHRAARTALQLHGAIGYTAEHELHRFLTKITALRQSWGDPAWHRNRLAEALNPDSPIGTS